MKVVADYQAAEKALDPNMKPEFVSLEGYLSGRLVASALENTGPDPTRADMLRVINDVGSFDISGTIMTFRAEDARRSQQGLSHGDPARRNFQGR